MELQSSNSSFIPPSVMAVLYRLTIARGIRGMNFFMMVGGANPVGYENDTGTEYDIDAPIAADGHTRPHYEVVRTVARLARGNENVLAEAEPLRDVWIGCSVPYDAQSLSGAALALDAWGIQTLLPQGEMGLSDVDGLQPLMAGCSVSWGCVDLYRWAATGEGAPGQGSQLWVGCLDHLDREVQERLARFVEEGGHLVLLPMVPTRDDRLADCDVLMKLAFSDSPPPRFAGFGGGFEGRSFVRTPAGGTLVAPGEVTTFDVPPGADVLAFSGPDNRPCAMSRAVGQGRLTVVGFRLAYDPDGGPAAGRLLVDVVEAHRTPRAAWATNPQCAVFELAGPAGGFACLVNPVDVPVTTGVVYTAPGTVARRELPSGSGGIEFSGRGALLLPVGLELGHGVRVVHGTWEVLEVGQDHEDAPDPGTSLPSLVATFATAGRTRGELLIEGVRREVAVEGGRVLAVTPGDQGTELLLSLMADAAEVSVRLVPLTTNE
jgi:beta-galactosidase